MSPTSPLPSRESGPAQRHPRATVTEFEEVRLLRLEGADPLEAAVTGPWQHASQEPGEGGWAPGPFLAPEVAQTIARHRSDVAVLVGYHESRPVAWLPLHLGPRGRTRALGGRFCDVHGPVGAWYGTDWHAALRQVGLRTWRFTRTPTPGSMPATSLWSRSTSPIIRVGAGLSDWKHHRRANGSRLIDQLQRKERKLAREVGPLRFAFAHPERKVLERLLHWKAQQRESTGSPDVFAEPWARASLFDLLAQGDGGTLSALWAGDHLVAAHFGLADTNTLHWWIPTYDRTFGAYSPGLVLMLYLVEACAQRGIRWIDLGHGGERYKSSLATSVRPLAAGCVDPNLWRSCIGRTGVQLREAVRQSPLESTWAATKRTMRRWKRS